MVLVFVRTVDWSSVVWTACGRCADKSGRAVQSAQAGAGVAAAAAAARPPSVPLVGATGRRAQPRVRFTDRPPLTLSASSRSRTASAGERSNADHRRRPPHAR